MTDELDYEGSYTAALRDHIKRRHEEIRGGSIILKSAPEVVIKAKDGDGDGFVHDGTPRMRPFNPATDTAVGRKKNLLQRKRDRQKPKSLEEALKERGKITEIPPRMEGEADFAWQSRVLDQLDPEDKHAIIADIRERTAVCSFIADGERRWRKAHDLPEPQVDWDTVRADTTKGRRIVDAVNGLQQDADNPEWRDAYTDFKRQNDEMYAFLTVDLGVTVEVWDERAKGKDDPYDTAEAQAQDLMKNRHLWVNRGGFFLGDNPDSVTGTNHPFMSAPEYEKFRSVHDAFGHAGIGGGFDRHGEYAAWMAHNSMYTGQGRKAMSTEYHAVNSYLWVTGTPFPQEKFGILLPDELIQNVFDEHGRVVRKQDADTEWRAWVISSLKLDSMFATLYDNGRKGLHHVLGPVSKDISKAARDGDGDGFVDDGKPSMRPVGTMLPNVLRRAKSTERVQTDYAGMRERGTEYKGGARKGTFRPGGKEGAARWMTVGGKSGAMPGFVHLAGEDPQKVLDQMVDNLEAIQSVADQRERENGFASRTRQWYDAANRMVDEIADEIDVHPDAMAGVTAVLSASMDWDNNIYSARQIATFWDEDPINTARIKKSAEDLVDQLNLDANGNLKPPGARIRLPEILPGTPLATGIKDPTARAVYFRAWDTVRTNGRPTTPNMTLTADGKIVPTGETQKTRYQSNQNIAKALAILDDPTPETLSTQLGDGLKVRSFYNNIAYPDSDQDDVTIDTHAGSSLVGAPYAANSEPFKTLTEARNTDDGQLVKVMMVEAFREIARRHPDKYRHPREAQSVLWELWRDRAAGSSGEDKAWKEALRAIWETADEPGLSPDEQRRRVQQARSMMTDWLLGKDLP